MEVDPVKLLKLRELLPAWLARQSARRKEVESLVGLLCYVAKCVRAARVFLPRLLAEVRYMPEGPQEWQLSAAFKQDLYWWHQFLPHFNGVSMISPSSWSGVNSVIETDACLEGGGAINFVLGEYFHFVFPSCYSHWAINEKELLVIMVAIKRWYGSLGASRFQINCDNSTAVRAMDLQYIRNDNVQACMREIAFWCAKGDFQMRTVFIEGAKNVYADWLSRWSLDPECRRKFLAMRREGWQEISVDEGLFSFTGEWC